ncbi:MAG: heavy-metal-associated domain-containing protein [Campylobacteraceae bacterium]
MRRVLLFIFFATFLFSKEAVIEIPTMHCPLCTTIVKKSITQLEGVKSAKVRLNTKEATVVFDENIVTIDKILESINATTYEPKLKSLK